MVYVSQCRPIITVATTGTSYNIVFMYQSCCLPYSDSVKHTLVEWPNSDRPTIRRRFFKVSSLKDRFDSIDDNVIIDLSKKVVFYNFV